MNIIVFFNGWGMGEEVLKDLKGEKGYEILNVSFPYDLDKEILKNYKRKIFVGWSFGVYYMCKFLNENKEILFDNAISINGTPKILGEDGIKEKIFNITLENMNFENLGKFYNNMNCDLNFKNKNIKKLIEELKYLKKNYEAQDNIISKAIIGEKDKIIKSKIQVNYYKENKIIIKKIDGGHYIFKELKSWEDIIK